VGVLVVAEVSEVEAPEVVGKRCGGARVSASISEIKMARRIVQEALNSLVEDLVATHGANLASVVLYGSAAAGDHIELRSDYNLLIALNRITPEDLRQAQAPMREWQRLGHPLPVYFTVEELSDAADVFPIEFHQMANARVLLYGRDPFEFVDLTDKELRHQTEYELRSKLIQLRRLYIPASVSIEKLCDLMSDSLASFAALFRAVLILYGQEAPVAKPDCVRATVALLKLDPEPFDKIFAIRATGYQPASDKAANDLFAAYMLQIEQVVEAVDELHRQADARA
jgi:predicted nucleotidyltransferase